MSVFRFAFSLISGVLTAGVVYQHWKSYHDRRRSYVPGRVVKTKSGTFYLHQQGSGNPVVVFESGLAASSLSWTLVQRQISELTQVCSYDRAGFGWSESVSQPRTGQNVSTELFTLLKAAAVCPPYILVGHSFGALLVRRFACSHPSLVVGIVMVDPVSSQYWARPCAENEKRLRLAAKLSRRGAVLAFFGIVRLALNFLSSGRPFFPKLVARATSGKANSLITRLLSEVRRLPPEVLPILRKQWSRSIGFRTMAAYLETLQLNAAEAELLDIPSSIPLTVISASNATDAELQERDVWVSRSKQGQHVRMENSGHWIQFEHPQVVIDAVSELLNIGQSSSEP